MNNLKTIIEGLLFLSGDEGLNMEQLIGVLELKEATIIEGINTLMDDYLDESRGIELVCFGGIYKFVSKEAIHPYAQKLFATTKSNVLSQPALETLAIVAYRQPVTRAEIEDIRGVGCDMMIRKLLARGLIKECGRTDAPGRPFLYEITNEFMDAFKLESLKELPELPEFSNRSDEELFDN